MIRKVHVPLVNKHLLRSCCVTGTRLEQTRFLPQGANSVVLAAFLSPLLLASQKPTSGLHMAALVSHNLTVHFADCPGPLLLRLWQGPVKGARARGPGYRSTLPLTATWVSHLTFLSFEDRLDLSFLLHSPAVVCYDFLWFPLLISFGT